MRALNAPNLWVAGALLCPDPAEGAYSAPPDPLAGFRGGPPWEGWGKGEREGMGERRREGREGDGGKGEGKGRGGLVKEGGLAPCVQGIDAPVNYKL